MIRSMTGFAARSITLTGDYGEKTDVSISIKSLNSRYFDTTCKVHYSLAMLEHTIIQKARLKLIRGHIYCTVHVTNPHAFRGAIEPARATIISYIHAIKEIQKLTNLDTPLSLNTVLQLPNVFVIADTQLNEELIKIIESLVEELLHTVNTMREQEGAALQKDIEERIAIMRHEIDNILEEAAVLIAQHKIKIQETLAALKIDENHITTAQKDSLFTVLDKMDIHEEVVRFKTHLESLLKHIKTEQAEHGKRIDFTLQELGREINTIASKCSNARISERTINIKVEIEKAREQAQNIL